MNLLKTIFLILSFLAITNCSNSNELFSGEWKEIENYPDFGVVVFTETNENIQGKYISVGQKQQKTYGFKVGEVILKLNYNSDKNEYSGKVLLRPPLKYCKGNCDSWVPITMKKSKDNKKLIGKWPQSNIDKNTGKRVFVGWQSYVLTKV